MVGHPAVQRCVLLAERVVAEQFGERQPLAVVGHGQAPPIARLRRRGRRPAAPSTPAGCRCASRVRPLSWWSSEERPERRDRRLELGDVDEAALTGAVTVLQPGEHGGEGVQPGEVVGRGDRGDARRHLIGVAGQLVQAGERCLVRAPGEELVVRLRLVGAEAWQGDVDDAGIDRDDVLVGQAEGPHRRRRVVGDEHVGVRQQGQGDLAGLGELEVQPDGPLVRRHLGDVRRGVHVRAHVHPGSPRRAEQPGDVGVAARLDLDHLGAVEREHPAAARCCDRDRQLDHRHIVEYAHGCPPNTHAVNRPSLARCAHH